MWSEEEEVLSTRVAIGGVSTDQTPKETIISMQDGDLSLTRGELANLRLLDGPKKATAQRLIRRVPVILGGNEAFKKYFTPKVIAIGPLHHDDPSLQAAEELKLKLATHFIENIGQEKEILYIMIKKDIANLKKCYDPKEIGRYFDDDEKLAWMFFLDGCTVLQAIFLGYAPDGTEKDTPNELKIKNDLLTFMYLDMLLLENQLPYRVLELLCSSNHDEKFMESVKRFIDNNVMTPAEMKKKQQKQQQKRKPAHLLDLLRSKMLFIKEDKRSPCQSSRCYQRFTDLCNRKKKTSHHLHTFRNVKELRQAGIWLKPSETSCLKDISFHRVYCVGKLRLRPITVDDSTGPKFMNLIAYEMCPDFDNDFAVTSYICFLDSLIDEAEDVKELRDAGILYNGLGSDEEVAKLFNKMNTDLVPSPSMYNEVKTQIQSHCGNIWITFAAQAYYTYFRSPWTFLAFAGAIAALVLSALQTYYTIHPKK